MYHEICAGDDIFRSEGNSSSSGHHANSAPSMVTTNSLGIPPALAMTPFDFDQLVTLGLGLETVNQLKSMRGYLQQNFNLPGDIVTPATTDSQSAATNGLRTLPAAAISRDISPRQSSESF